MVSTQLIVYLSLSRSEEKSILIFISLTDRGEILLLLWALTINVLAAIMNPKLDLHSFRCLIFLTLIGGAFCAMSMKQLLKSMDMMRDTCAPKFSLSAETLAGLRKGIFPEDRELKCYTLCIAQMAGTITRKNEISLEKTIKQLESMLPPDVKQLAIETVTLCKDVQKQYKDPCDKTFYSTKCAFELQPEKFMFP